MNRRIFAGVGAAVMMAFLVGCDEIKFGGTMTIHEIMTFAQRGEDPYDCNQKPDWWNCKPGGNVVINPGQFQTNVTLGMSGQEKMIKMEVKNNGSKPTVVELLFDKNIATNDHFVLKAGQIKQNFDVTGDIVTTVTKTPEESSNESCTYQVQEMVCRGSKSADTVAASTDELSAKVEEAVLDFGKRPGGFPGQYPGYPGQYPGYPGQYPGYPGQYPGYPGYPGQYNNPSAPNCHPVWVTRYGWQYVRFYFETTTKDITASFVQTDKSLADYKGTGSKTEKVYTYQSPCR